MIKRLTILLLVFLALSPMACTSDESPAGGSFREDSEHAQKDGKIAIPLAVRRNLGITFASPEKRAIAESRYLPALVEAPKSARQHLRARFRGRVELKVKQYQKLKQGDLIAILQPLDRLAQANAIQEKELELEKARAEASKTSFEVKKRVAQRKSAEAAIRALDSIRAARLKHVEALLAEVDAAVLREKKLTELNKSGGGLAQEISEIRFELASRRSALAEGKEEIADSESEKIRLTAALAEANAEEQSARNTQLFADSQLKREQQAYRSYLGEVAEHFVQDPSWLLDAASATKVVEGFQGLELRASKALTVAGLFVADGELVDVSEEIAELLDTTAYRIRAQEDQASMLTTLENAKAVAYLPNRESEAIEGELRFALEANPESRSADLLFYPSNPPAWLRAGLALHLSLQPKKAKRKSIAIPRKALIQDGLEMVYFLRDRSNKDKAMRMVADVGASDGEWVEIKSGLMIADEVVLDGVYELKLASSASATKGGHFHADGTWHEGEH